METNIAARSLDSVIMNNELKITSFTQTLQDLFNTNLDWLQIAGFDSDSVCQY